MSSQSDLQNQESTSTELTGSSGEAPPVYRVKILHSSSTAHFRSPESIEVKNGDYVVIPTQYGKDIGKVLGRIKISTKNTAGQIPCIVSLLQQSDLRQYEINQEKDSKAFKVCRQKIKEYNLNMKLVSAHYLFGEPKILFFFTAESRVDFRELVKTLVSIFKTRIELRQIGVRDESRVLGGIGVCGRGYCCHALTDKLNPVSIKMAKKQNLSLNSLKISGPCGRLLCCLAYEYPYYSEVKNKLPSEGTRIVFENEISRVIEVNILSKQVKLVNENGSIASISFDRLHFCPKQKKWKINGPDQNCAGRPDEGGAN